MDLRDERVLAGLGLGFGCEVFTVFEPTGQEVAHEVLPRHIEFKEFSFGGLVHGCVDKELDWFGRFFYFHVSLQS